MKTVGRLVVASLVFLAIADLGLVDAQAEKGAQPKGQVGRSLSIGMRQSVVEFSGGAPPRSLGAWVG